MKVNVTQYETPKKSAASANAGATQPSPTYDADFIRNYFMNQVVHGFEQLQRKGVFPPACSLRLTDDTTGEDLFRRQFLAPQPFTSPKGIRYPLPDETKAVLAVATTSETIAIAIWKCRKDGKITRRLSNNADFQWYCIRLSANPDITQGAVRKQLERLGG